MRLDYHDFSEDDFERLVVAICAEILGTGVSPFAKGKDSAKDARFEGTAADLPNAAAPHKGEFIVQAKQTENPVAKYSDPDFSGDAKSSVLSEELPGVKKLVKAKKLDCYLLFSNRKMTGVSEDPIIERIKKETGAKTVELFGIERIDLLLKKHPQALVTFGQQQASPLLVCADDLSEVILAISNNHDAFAQAIRPDEFERKSFKAKNVENGLSEDFAGYISRRFIPYFDSVKKFLASPDNDEAVGRYESAADEFEEQIAIHKKDYARFDDVLNRITSLLFKRDGDLARKKRLTRLVVYYMYWNCDIGSEVASDASA